MPAQAGLVETGNPSREGRSLSPITATEDVKLYYLHGCRNQSNHVTSTDLSLVKG